MPKRRSRPLSSIAARWSRQRHWNARPPERQELGLVFESLHYPADNLTVQVRLANRPGARLVNLGSGQTLANHLLPAFDSATRRTGLLKHTSLPPGHAMIIAPCSAIHTFFMKFPIDVLFVARDGRVLKVQRDLRPWRMSARLGAYAVIELAAGTVDSAGPLSPGDRLDIVWEGHADH